MFTSMLVIFTASCLRSRRKAGVAPTSSPAHPRARRQDHTDGSEVHARRQEARAGDDEKPAAPRSPAAASNPGCRTSDTPGFDDGDRGGTRRWQHTVVTLAGGAPKHGGDDRR